MVTKIALWCLIDEAHRDFKHGRISYDQALVYLNAYLKVAEKMPEKSRQSIIDRIHQVMVWIFDLHKEGDR